MNIGVILSLRMTLIKIYMQEVLSELQLCSHQWDQIKKTRHETEKLTHQFFCCGTLKKISILIFFFQMYNLSGRDKMLVYQKKINIEVIKVLKSLFLRITYEINICSRLLRTNVWLRVNFRHTFFLVSKSLRSSLFWRLMQNSFFLYNYKQTVKVNG